MLLSRRQLLHLSGTGYAAMSLGGMLRAQAAAEESKLQASRPKIRSCIFIFFYGGPSHLDTYDMKPGAATEVRGEFQPISTSVPGLQISEHLPRMSRIMHKVALVRSLHHTNRLHDSASIETLTGRQAPQGDREEFAPIPQVSPAYGATLSYLRRDQNLAVPHAALPYVFHNVVDVPCQGGGFLGSAYDPLRIDVDPASRTYRAEVLNARPGLSRTRLAQRRALLTDLELGRANLGSVAPAREVRRFYDKALQLLASDDLRTALDIEQEPAAVRERYGFFDEPQSVGEGGGGGNGAEMGYCRQMRGQNFLLARRLVEAGVPFVNVYDFRQQGKNWDAHFKVFNQHKNYLLPQADQALSALIEDLDERGLLESTLVVALGEFGRTPRINQDGGRDHWPDCYTGLLAGGGIKGGFVYGASDAIGAYPALDPVTPADVAATVFWRFGIDPATHIHDLTGRPYRVADGKPIVELFTS